MADKAVYTKPADQVWKEEMVESGFASPKNLSSFGDDVARDDENARKLVVEGNDLTGYVGVDPIYQNYAEEVNAPLVATKGVDADLADQLEEDTKVEESDAKAAKPDAKPASSDK